MVPGFDAVTGPVHLTLRRGLAVALAILLLPGTVGCDESVDHLVAQAAAMREAGELRAAASTLDAVLVKQPKNIAARLLAAQIYIDLERGDAALGLLMRARDDGVDQRQIIKLWVQAEFFAQRYREVLDYTAELAEDLPGPVRASLLAYRGGALAALGQAAAAQREFEDGLAADPHLVEVRVIAGRLAIDRGDTEGARQLLAAAIHEAPDDRRLRRLEGDIAYAAGEYAAADWIYRKLLESEPWNELLRGQLAAVQVAENKISDAVSTLDAVLLDPKQRKLLKHPLLNYVRALAALRQNDYIAAQSNAAAVVATVPEFERARLTAGAASYALKSYEQAYYYLSPYIAANPDDIAARKLLAATQLRLGRPADAVDTLGPVKDETTDVELLQLIGEASARGGDMPAARRYLNLALKYQPDNGRLRAQLGIVELAAGDVGAAIRESGAGCRPAPRRVIARAPAVCRLYANARLCSSARNGRAA